uniref:Uncharacterized protein n=1 Tax=Timema douglasi TaxID=61478 RepID=A0A7R8VP76_TIMDO|nr:unnamed protein product [Timema douglasi]
MANALVALSSTAEDGEIEVALLALIGASLAFPQFQKYDKLKITHSGNVGLGTPSAIIRPVTPIRPVFDTGLVYTKPIIPAQVLPIVPPSIPAGVPQATYRGASGLVNGREANILILKQANDQIGNGYVYSFETENGIATQETGSLKSFGPKGDAIVAEGVYRYTAPNGVLIETRYSADENGFRAEGAHLPVGPPIPDYILRSLEYIAANPPKPERSSLRK